MIFNLFSDYQAPKPPISFDNLTISDEDKCIPPSPQNTSNEHLYGSARKIIDELLANPVPANELTYKQRFSILLLEGLLKPAPGGGMDSIYPVAITDNPEGGYMIFVDKTPQNDP